MMKIQLRVLFLVLFCSLSGIILAQKDSVWHQKPELNLSVFADVFHVYDFNEPQGTKRQSFLFNHNRHNEFNVNLGLIKLGLEHTKYRANVAFHAGTYVNDNYAAEPGLLKNIFEANVGISLSKKNKLWLDAGVFPSHIGFESAVSMDNWTLTRSLLAESSPYFLSGAKLTYNPNEKLELAALVVNGWQRIRRLQGNSMLSFGTQLNFTPSDKFTLNWSTFIGTDDPDLLRRMRYFNNLYGQFQITKKFGLIAGFDAGVQQAVKGSSSYEYWLSPVVIAQFAISKTWKTALRGEYYEDQWGVIIPTGTMNGFQTIGVSLNVDYAPAENVMCRLEGRWLNSKDNVFPTETTPTNNNFIIGASIAVRFSEALNGKKEK